jgi:hypothetical protein
MTERLTILFIFFVYILVCFLVWTIRFSHTRIQYTLLKRMPYKNGVMIPHGKFFIGGLVHSGIFFFTKELGQ